VAQVQDFYNPVTRSDLDKLKKLSRILRTPEWAAQVSARKDQDARTDGSTATADFSFSLTWKDAFGGRLTSHPVFRAEFTRSGGQMSLSSCRIVGSPKL
jgi:hypothetical protein